MSDLPVTPNSHKYKDTVSKDREPLQKIIKSEAKVKKPSSVRKFAEVFLAEDIDSIKSAVWNDYIVPYTKKTIIGAVDFMLNGRNSTVNRNQYSNSRYGYTSYNTINQPPRPVDSYKPRSNRHDYNTIAIDSKGEAEAVLFAMEERIRDYGRVSIADFYDLIGIDCDFTDYKYGWNDLSNTYIHRMNDGYSIHFDKAVVLD